MQITRKPRARPMTYILPDGTHYKGWRATFPGWAVGFVSSTLEGALRLAHRMHATRINAARNGTCAYPFDVPHSQPQ